MALDIIKFVSSANREEISKDVFGGYLGEDFRDFFILVAFWHFARNLSEKQSIFKKTLEINSILGNN